MARRVDRNQSEIVKLLRELGASVQILSDIGKGCPDICFGIFGANYLAEIKDGDKPPSQQKLTEFEKEFFVRWKGQVTIFKNQDDVVYFISALNKKRKES